ncbi:MAG: DUF1825 family protein [Cyanobacteria bacterium J06642_2]
MGFFDSDIVQQEAKELFRDFQGLMQVGSNYGKFDRAGKKLYIEQMEALMERQRIFMKRMELSDDFMAQMSMKQMETQMNGFGVSQKQMYEHMQQALARMKAEAESE